MDSTIVLGIAGVLVGGVLNGSFVAPMKKIHGWRWENSWLVYSVWGLIVIPWAAALVTLPQLTRILASTPWPVLFKVLAFGFGWGIGSVLFGLGVARLGLAVGYGIILGLNAPIGTFLPLIVLYPERLWARQGQALIIGTLIVIVGVFFCARAGRQREQARSSESSAAGRSRFAVGLLICIVAGLFSPMLNFCFVFGEELQNKAIEFGADPGLAVNVIWALALTAGFFTNGGYAVYLLTKNRSWSNYSRTGASSSQWYWGSLMGFIFFGSFLAYGAGATVLGSLGGIVGWPLFMSMSLIASNLLGALSGEWKGSPRRACVNSIIGIALLIVAVIVISRGSQGS
jgi:L-rhamnose-H+ transport protein